MTRAAAVALLLVPLACDERPTDAELRALAPAPLPRLEAPGPVEAAPFGAAVPSDAVTVTFDGETLRRGAKTVVVAELPPGSVALAAEPGVFFAQLAGPLAALADAGRDVLLVNPADPSLAYPLELMDETEFAAWLDEPVPGKIRVIQRADGFELSTNLGKLAGRDPNGPSLPIRGGRLDLAGLRQGLGLLARRFPDADDACLVPSYGTEVERLADALSGFFVAPGEARFETVCLVHPRPPAHH